MRHNRMYNLLKLFLYIILMVSPFELVNAQALPKKKKTETKKTKKKLLNPIQSSQSITQPNKSPHNCNKEANYESMANEKQLQISVEDGNLNGYGYVDLGLPSGTKWATYNVGASSPTDLGEYYTEKNVYLEQHSEVYIKIFGENETKFKNWGFGWEVPTEKQYEELFNNCSYTWTYFKGTSGYLFKGLNGHTLFLPAGGKQTENKNIIGKDTQGYYWTATTTLIHTKLTHSSLWFDKHKFQFLDIKLSDSLLTRFVTK